MAAPVGSLYVSLTADTEKFIGNFKTAERSVDHFGRRTEMVLNRNQAIMAATQRQLSAFGASFASAFKGGIVGAIGGIGISQIASSVRTVVAETAKLADVSAKLGVGTNELQELGFAANQSGVEITALHTSLEQFGKRIGEASRGSGELFEVLKANGVAIRDQHGNIRPLMALLSDYAELVRRAKTEQERLTLANIAFGRSGGDMTLMLANGAAGLDTLRQAARDAGVVLREDLVKSAAEIDDRWEELTAAMTTRFQTFVLSVVDGLEAIRAQAQRAAGITLGSETGRLIAETPTSAPTVTSPAISERPTIIPTKDSSVAKTRQEREAVERLIESLRMELSLLAKTDAERAVATNLRAAGAAATADQRKQIESLTRALVEGERVAMSAAQAAQFFAEEAFAGVRGLLPQIETGIDAVDRLANSFVDAALQASLLGQGPLSGLFGSAGSGGIFGTLASALAGAIMPTPASAVPIPRMNPLIKHGGGFVGPGGMQRNVAAMAYAAAPRFHAGLGDNEFAAILERGERVQTAAMARREAGIIGGLSSIVASGMGGGEVKVEIINNTGAPVQEERSSEGGYDIHRVIIGAVNKGIAEGRLDRMMRETYNVQRQGRR